MPLTIVSVWPLALPVRGKLETILMTPLLDPSNAGGFSSSFLGASVGLVPTTLGEGACDPLLQTIPRLRRTAKRPPTSGRREIVMPCLLKLAAQTRRLMLEADPSGVNGISTLCRNRCIQH